MVNANSLFCLCSSAAVSVSRIRSSEKLPIVISFYVRFIFGRHSIPNIYIQYYAKDR